MLNQIGTRNNERYNQQIRSNLNTFALYHTSYALRQDPFVWEKMRQDAVVSFCMDFRKMLAAGNDWFLEPASTSVEDRKAAKILESLIRRIKDFTGSRYNMAEAIIRGISWQKISGQKQVVKIEGLSYLEWFTITALTEADSRRFQQFPIEGEKNIYEWKLEDPKAQVYDKIVLSDWVTHVHEKREADLGYGTGLADRIFTYWYFKAEAMDKWLKFVDRWAGGLIHGKIESLRDGNASTPGAQDKAEQLKDALSVMRANNVIVHDKDDEIEIIDAPPNAGKAAQDLIEYLDAGIKVLCLGSGLPTEGDSKGGSFALAKIQADSTKSIVMLDRSRLEETITRDIVGYLWRYNFPILRELGLANVSPPHFKIRDDVKDSPLDRMTVISQAKASGIQLRKDEVYSQLGFSPPLEGDEIL